MTWFKAALAIVFLGAMAPMAQAEIDGHGPDSWRVTNVSVGDVLNARMGPGTNYPVIETFSDYERGLQQITCVPFYTAAHFMAMSEAQIAALPQRWCLMRDASMRKAGWVAQRYITPDGEVSISAPKPSVSPPARPKAAPSRATAPTARATAQPEREPYAPHPNMDPVDQAVDLVREIYERQFLSEGGSMPSAFDPAVAQHYFTDDIVAWLASGNIGAHPLYGAQDFDGAINEPEPDPERPMYRGMITINVDFTNFGQKQRVVFYIRADTTKASAPLRIFNVEHEGWSYP